jgi:hypothetical protein
MVTVRTVSLTVNFASHVLTNVIGARGEIAADTGWPTCSVFVTSKPTSGNEEDNLSVVAGAGNNVTRFTGKLRRFRPSAFPKSIEMVAVGTLAYANEWAPAKDFRFGFGEEFPDGSVGFFPDGGVTDQAIIQFVLSQVPGVSYSSANIDGTSIPLGSQPGAWSAFDWKAGTTAWAYIQNIDRATLYRTYQDRTGTIRRVKMIGHPDNTTSFTLANADILEGASGDRNTEQTRNAVEVRGHDYGTGDGPVLGSAYGSNAFQGDGAVAATRHPEVFESDLVEDGDNSLGDPYGLTGLNADDIAVAILPDVNKEFVEASVPSWRDDTHGPGMTCLLDCLSRLAIGEPMWVARHAWEVGDNGWVATYGLTGGGLPQTNPAPPV